MSFICLYIFLFYFYGKGVSKTTVKQRLFPLNSSDDQPEVPGCARSQVQPSHRYQGTGGVPAAAPDVLTAAAVVTGPLLEPLDSVCSWGDFSDRQTHAGLMAAGKVL